MEQDPSRLHLQEYDSLTVFHRMRGTGAFVDTVRALAEEYLGRRYTGSLAINGQKTTRTMGYPYFETISPSDLQLITYEQRDHPARRASGKYSTMKQKLRFGTNNKVKRNRSSAESVHQGAVASLEHSLGMLLAKSQVECPEEGISVSFANYSLTTQPDVRNGLYTVSLQPNFATDAGRLVEEYSSETFRLVAAHSRSVAYPQARTLVHMPILKVKSDIPRDGREETFLKELQNELPLTARMTQQVSVV